MLRLAHPAPSGQGTRPSKRRPAPVFTPTEQMRLRAALRNLRALYGSWTCLAEVMGVQPTTLARAANGQRIPSAAIGIAAARAAGETLDRLIGAPVSADRCPHCGAVRGAS